MTPDDVTPTTRPPKTWAKVVGLWCAGLLSVVIVLFMAALGNMCKVRDAAARAQDHNNLKQLVLAQHNFASEHDGILGPYAHVTSGVMNTKLSFRVSLLPYMEQLHLFGQIDLSQTWDSPRNAPVTSIAFKTLQSPDTPDRTKPDTPYRVFYGGGALFEADGTPVKLTEVPDGLSNTILFVHATEAVPWAKPQEFPYTPATPLPPLGSPGLGKGGFNVAFADGSVRFVRHTIAEADLRSLIEKADGRGAGIE